MSADETTPPIPYETSPGEEWSLAGFKFDCDDAHGFVIISGEHDPKPWGLFDDRETADAVCGILCLHWESEWGKPRVYYARNTASGIEYWNGPAVEDIDERVKKNEVKP